MSFPMNIGFIYKCLLEKQGKVLRIARGAIWTGKRWQPGPGTRKEVYSILIEFIDKDGIIRREDVILEA
jgi:hypothetical protein